MGWLYEVEDILLKINNEKLPESQTTGLRQSMLITLFTKGNTKSAIPFLETAIKSASHKQQIYPNDILLAQLYAATQNPTKAYQTYGKVIGMHPIEPNSMLGSNKPEVYLGKDISKEVKNRTKKGRGS